MARRGLFDMPDPLLLKLKDNIFQIQQKKKQFKYDFSKTFLFTTIMVFFITVTLLLTFTTDINYWVGTIFIIVYGWTTLGLIYRMAYRTLLLTNTTKIQKFIDDKRNSQTINNEELYNIISQTDILQGKITIAEKLIEMVCKVNIITMGLIYVVICFYYIFKL
jgi:hypothetical protein